MREIKFRQFVNGEFHYWGFDTPDKNSFTSPAKTTDADAYPSCQFTGLKDNNGKDIYEGDIVSAAIYADEKPTITTVIEEKGCFLIEYKDSESDFVPVGWFVGVIEVIGNIYENPGLL
jgi:uncharacterized phage protein (TIGR01671 family)